MSDNPRSVNPDRRGFLKGAGALVVGAGALGVPVGTGLAVFLEPRSGSETGGAFIKVASTNALPADGVPRKFSVLADRVNAWNRQPAAPVGAVYLRRTDETTIEAFNVVCPHAGCLVEYAPDRDSYLCPCHESTFALDGTINDPQSPAPRGLDALEVNLRNGTEIWVRFRNFRTGKSEQIPA
ncbi:MAG: Rieske 2Fe-2S domain-containing protein [Verrucomicrobiales bacterium]|nr:Rieske 2Fe-2S domain-containing protein [Verrucomicrobiales bacterium]